MQARWIGILCVAGACTPHIDQVPLRSAGDHDAAFEHGGVQRDVLVHVPVGHPAAGGAPLVVALHGGGSSGAGMADATGFNTIADREGFVVAYPNALGVASGLWRVWNSGDCSGPACWFGVDDLGLIEAVVDRLQERLAVDPTRIYLVGYSSGGAMAFRAAARSSDRFAALAVFAAPMAATGPVHGPQFRDALPAVPLSVLTLFASEDPWIPEHGREHLDHTDVSQRHIGQFWASSARCPQRAERYLERDGAIRVSHFKGCDGGTEVKQLTLSGWNHEWPSAEQINCKPEGDPLRGFDAAETIWKFFANKRR